MPKQFHLFVFDVYYPAGGISEYKGSFEDLEDAIKVADTDWLDWDCVEVLESTQEGLALKARRRGGILFDYPIPRWELQL